VKTLVARTVCGIALAVSFVSAQAPQQSALVVEGGTLLDGNGGTPLPDSLVVIQGNKIAAVGRKEQVAVPPNARVINATGKFVLPGLWESQTAYSWYFGEAMLNHGITSSIDVGTEAEVAVPHRDAVLHGKDLAPRAFTGILRIGSTLNGATGYEGPLHTIRVPKSADDTRAVVRTVLNAGADYVIFYDGALPFEWYKAGVEEAHKWASLRSCARTALASSRRRPQKLVPRSCHTPRAFRSPSRKIHRSSGRDATTARSSTSTATWTMRRRRS